MKFLNVLLIALSTASAHAYDVSCFKSGPATDATNVAGQIGPVCDYLKGDYAHNEERYKCVVDTIGVKWDFKLKHVSDGNREIGKEECENGMNKQIQCKYGGTTKYGNWEYTADPNDGSCGSS